MKTTISIILAILICGILSGLALGQTDKPVASLIDEVRTARMNCEEGFARLDNFFIHLDTDPNSQGWIIIYEDGQDRRAGKRLRQQLFNFIKMTRRDPSRVTFLEGPARKEGKTQFWLVPSGADHPVILPGDIAIGPPPPVKADEGKPYFYAAEYSDGIPDCSGNLYDLAEYAAVLKSDPKNRGRIIISESSQAKFKRKEREILKELAANGIPRTHIKMVYKNVRRNGLPEGTELWVVPPAAKAKP